MDWREIYKRRLVSAEEAMQVVKSGDTVVFPHGGEPEALGFALAARKEEVRGVKVLLPVPRIDFGWYDPGWEDSFQVIPSFATAMARKLLDERRIDYLIETGGRQFTKPLTERTGDFPRMDIYLTQVSPPDANGFCSFGAVRWDKKEMVRRARVSIAQVNPRFIRTYGDNFIHVSEITSFVEHESEILERPVIPQEPAVPAIAQYVSQLIRDGDTIQIGAGTASEGIVGAGALNDKLDLGLHTERCTRGLVDLVVNGVITGKRKSLHTGKAIAANFACSAREETLIDRNPQFEAYSVEHINDIRTIAGHDNFVAINSALAVDFTGQTAAESLGARTWSGPGGQIAFAVGAFLSHGGRFISCLPSTAAGGKVSRIVPQLDAGTTITVPRTFADYVVTEYGIARLMGKTARERAQGLIAVAHPDFRAELQKAARKLFWP
ncbi:MAG: 4-hydroxybutyrate CoA-transferase [Chloroflexi bacterium]|nr:4-hydroxybutyrate CoA-transferase [Chloroflexota bacterium]